MATRKRYEDIDAEPELLQEIREKNGVPDSVVEDPTRSILGIPEPASAEAQAFNRAVARQLGIQIPDLGDSGDTNQPN
ncbi:MAG TPA: hypothetical protein VN892_06880 [Solirubrobacteraceae bacterium]|nr:hypothetical protein [Solirubrobacteraceae bacterium]